MEGFRLRWWNRFVGLSNEAPRRLWVAIPFLLELRLYRFGVEIYLGPPGHFLAIEAGSAGFGAEWVAVAL
jgi:hypothetical protein